MTKLWCSCFKIEGQEEVCDLTCVIHNPIRRHAADKKARRIAMADGFKADG